MSKLDEFMEYGAFRFSTSGEAARDSGTVETAESGSTFLGLEAIEELLRQ